MINDGKDYKEMYEMIPQRKQVHVKNVYFGQKFHISLKNRQQQQEQFFFCNGPPSNNFRFGGHTSRGRYQRQSWPRDQIQTRTIKN